MGNFTWVNYWGIWSQEGGLVRWLAGEGRRVEEGEGRGGWGSFNKDGTNEAPQDRANNSLLTQKNKHNASKQIY